MALPAASELEEVSPRVWIPRLIIMLFHSNQVWIMMGIRLSATVVSATSDLGKKLNKKKYNMRFSIYLYLDSRISLCWYIYIVYCLESRRVEEKLHLVLKQSKKKSCHRHPIIRSYEKKKNMTLTEPQNHRIPLLEVGLALVVIYTNELLHLPLVIFLQSSHWLETKGN